MIPVVQEQHAPARNADTAGESLGGSAQAGCVSMIVVGDAMMWAGLPGAVPPVRATGPSASMACPAPTGQARNNTMADQTGLTRAARDDINYARAVLNHDAEPTVEGGADIASLCETIRKLEGAFSAIRAERDAMKAAIAELAPETAKLRAALEEVQPGLADAKAEIAAIRSYVLEVMAERNALKAEVEAARVRLTYTTEDERVGALVRALPVGWWLEINMLPECEYHVEVGKWGNPSCSTMDDLADAICVAYLDAGIEVPNA